MSKSKIVMLLLGMLAIAAAALYKLYALPTYQDAGAALTATENALAASDALLIASIDLDHIRNLEAKLNGKAMLPDLKSEAETGGSALSILRQAVMARPDAIAYVSAAAYAGKDGVLSSALVAGGDIQPEEVVAALKRSAQVQRPSAAASPTERCLAVAVARHQHLPAFQTMDCRSYQGKSHRGG